MLEYNHIADGIMLISLYFSARKIHNAMIVMHFVQHI